MRVFITGATGYIGSAVAGESVGAGHQVVGLARSEAAAGTLTAAGVEVHRGSLADLDGLRAQAEAADGVVHTAFAAVRRGGNVVPPGAYAAAVQEELQAIETLGGALAGSDRPFVVTSGTAGLTSGRVATELDTVDPGPAVALRAPLEGVALSFADRGVRASVVRLAPAVHGHGDRGFVPTLIGIARATSVSAYLGDGSNHWAAVHRLDAAALYRVALETVPAGARLHAVGDEGVPMRAIAEVIGRRLDLPVVGMSADEAEGHFGWFAPLATFDNRASSDLTQQRTGWKPLQDGLIDDLDQSHYFD